MGAVYSISGDLKYKSSSDIVAATKEFVASYNGARFSDTDFNDLKGALECIFTKRGLDINYETNKSIKFNSDFDASYGWESVMIDWFDEVATLLSDGSYLKIYPDSGVDYGVVSGGIVDWEAEEEISDELTVDEFHTYMYEHYPELELISEEEGTGDNHGYMIMRYDITDWYIDPEVVEELDNISAMAYIPTWFNPNVLVVMCKIS